MDNKVYIEAEVCKLMLESVNPMPPESGGIIGKKGNQIDNIFIDNGTREYHACSYSPDVDVLNRVISEWAEEGIEFAGIFHSHYFGVKTLSEGDKKYISDIMDNMPNDIKTLFFPLVVMPQREIVVYRACKVVEGIDIDIINHMVID